MSQTYPVNRVPVLLLLLAMTLPVAVGVFPNINPFLLFSIIPLALLVLGIAYYRPAVFLAFALYASEFKDLRHFRDIQAHVDLTVVALAAVAVSILARSIVKPTPGRFAGVLPPVFAFGLFVAVVAASYLHTPAPIYGGFMLTRFALIGGFLFLAPFFLINQEADFRQFAMAYILVSIVNCFTLFGRVEMISNSQADLDVTRIGSGWSIGLAIVILLFYRVIESDFWRKIFTVVALPCLIAGLFAAASRGAILATLTALFACFLFSDQPHKKTRLVVAVGVMAVCSVVAFSYLQYMGNGKYQHKLSEFIQLSEGQQTEGSGGKRLVYYRAALREITERPIVGLGVGGWSIYFFGRDQHAHPHDLFLEVATEEGAIGVAALLLFIWTLYDALKSLMSLSGARFIALVGAVVLTFTATMFSGDLDDDRVLWFWCGMSIAVLRMVKSHVVQAWLWQRAPVWMQKSRHNESLQVSDPVWSSSRSVHPQH